MCFCSCFNVISYYHRNILLFFFESLNSALLEKKKTHLFLIMPCLFVVKGMTMQCKCELPNTTWYKTLPSESYWVHVVLYTLLGNKMCWFFFSQIETTSGRHLGNTEHFTSHWIQWEEWVRVELKSSVKLKIFDHNWNCSGTAGGRAGKLPARYKQPPDGVRQLYCRLFSCTT